MLFMTAKVNKKKLILVLGIVVAAVIAAVMLFGRKSSAPTLSGQIATNDDRVRFLTDFGWDVAASPVESSQAQIPLEPGNVFLRYNELQKSQGYDLTQYSGKKVMRYVYKVKNFPGASDPVYATMLIYKNQVIGGDITNTAPSGSVQGFKNSATTIPSVSSPPEESSTEASSENVTQ